MTSRPRRLDVSGGWFGRYFYPNAHQPPVSFFANLQEAGGEGAIRVSGTTSEPNTIGFGPAQVHALISGTRTADAVTFSKMYDGEGHLAHAVRYDGRLSDDGTRLAGTWFLEGLQGTFEMTRPILDEAVEQVEREVEVLLPSSR